jgi:hypothetical protein
MMIFGVFKEFDKRITIFVTLGVVALLAYLLEPILDDLMWIAICAMIGYALFIPLTLIAKRDWNYHKVYNNEKVKIQTRKEAEANADSTAIYM